MDDGKKMMRFILFEEGKMRDIIDANAHWLPPNAIRNALKETSVARAGSFSPVEFIYTNKLMIGFR